MKRRLFLPALLLAVLCSLSAARAAVFSDVAGTSWYAPYVSEAAERGLMSGVGNDRFAPEQSMTRAMLVTVLYQLADRPQVQSGGSFSDVPDGSWYADAVNWAAEQGIAAGTGGGCFSPEQSVTREQLSMFFLRYLEWYGVDTTGTSSLSAFTDAGSCSSYAADSLSRCVYRGLLSGTGGGLLSPKGTATRAQCAAVLLRLKALLERWDAEAHPITGGALAELVCEAAAVSEGTAQCDSPYAGWGASVLEQGWLDWDELPPTGTLYDSPIPRQTAVKLIMKALLPGAQGDYLTESAKMSDFSSLSGRYYEAVLAAYASGTAESDSEGRFRPEDSLTLWEANDLIANALAAREAGGARAVAADSGSDSSSQEPDSTPVPSPVTTVKGGVSENGALQVIGTQLCNQAGEPIVLHGMSSHGLQWYSDFASSAAIASTAAYGANVFRAAMYTAEGGYLSDPAGMRQKLIRAVDAAIENDLYVIIDWHILSDGDPMSHIEEAEAFFRDISARYADCPNVLYEICNEPNGGVTWSGSIRPYAERLISVIRENSDGIILIGCGTWSQDLQDPAADPIQGENLMATCHFYAGTHGQWLRDRIDAALQSGLPVFVSEWGVSAADGSGGVYTTESTAWLDFLEERGISWCCWSLCDKNETSAALLPGADPSDGISTSELSEAGKFVFSRF